MLGHSARRIGQFAGRQRRAVDRRTQGSCESARARPSGHEQVGDRGGTLGRSGPSTAARQGEADTSGSRSVRPEIGLANAVRVGEAQQTEDTANSERPAARPRTERGDDRPAGNFTGGNPPGAARGTVGRDGAVIASPASVEPGRANDGTAARATVMIGARSSDSRPGQGEVGAGAGGGLSGGYTRILASSGVTRSSPPWVMSAASRPGRDWMNSRPASTPMTATAVA